MPSLNPYLTSRNCADCHTGEWIIYNIGYPPTHANHRIHLCERHYRQAQRAASRFELTLRAG